MQWPSPLRRYSRLAPCKTVLEDIHVAVTTCLPACRAEFRVWHKGSECYYIMYEKVRGLGAQGKAGLHPCKGPPASAGLLV